jgi:lipid II:glycine glycyltransferase (peptidoglycan interpeptide bridge formation enzyme)
MIPETEAGPTAHKLITQTGLKPVINQTGYQTVWIDLNKDQETLRAELRPNWRNALSKAERLGLTVDWDMDNQHIDWACGIYATDKTMRGYNGIPPALLKNYATILAPKQGMVIGRAMQGSGSVAFIVLVCHGRSATYLAGWSSQEGRETSAHHLLLWNAMLALKYKGIRELDLGGINDEEASGIKTFKEGLGGRVVRTVGQYA